MRQDLDAATVLVGAKPVSSSLIASSILSVCIFTSCTTYVQPTTCEANKSECGGIRDARFCAYIAVNVSGADCETLGLVASKPFCVVSPAGCMDTDYAVKGRDCKVVRYQGVRDSCRNDCAPGVPMFVSQ